MTCGTQTNQVGSLAAPIDPGLLPLGNYGGALPTHALKVGSVAIDTGNNNAALTNDQRGTGFPRVLNSIADVVPLVGENRRRVTDVCRT